MWHSGVISCRSGQIEHLDHHSLKIGLVWHRYFALCQIVPPRQIKGRKSQPLGGYQRNTHRPVRGRTISGQLRTQNFSGVSEKPESLFASQAEHLREAERRYDFDPSRPKPATRPSPKLAPKPVPGKPPGIGGCSLMSFPKRASALKTKRLCWKHPNKTAQQQMPHCIARVSPSLYVNKPLWRK